MIFRNRNGWVILVVVATTTPALSQDISWTQPYSGNIVYGPVAPSPGPLPNCPECQCDICQPGGEKGFLKRLFGRAQRCRREYYYCRQLYHTSYTPPVLPPYCEIGYGYYETTWRPPGLATVECDPVGQPILPEFEPLVPAVPPAPVDGSPKPNVMDDPKPEDEPDKQPSAGDEKPRYEEPENPGTARWQDYVPLSERPIQMPIITPR